MVNRVGGNWYSSHPTWTQSYWHVLCITTSTLFLFKSANLETVITPEVRFRERIPLWQNLESRYSCVRINNHDPSDRLIDEKDQINHRGWLSIISRIQRNGWILWVSNFPHCHTGIWEQLRYLLQLLFVSGVWREGITVRLQLSQWNETIHRHPQKVNTLDQLLGK